MTQDQTTQDQTTNDKTTNGQKLLRTLPATFLKLKQKTNDLQFYIAH